VKDIPVLVQINVVGDCSGRFRRTLELSKMLNLVVYLKYPIF